MSQRIVISVDPYEARAALLSADQLVNVEIENSNTEKRKGNIYKARITAIELNLKAAFVDYGEGKDGFLPFDEFNVRNYREITGKAPATGRFGARTGDWILVQVSKEEVGKKGASLTMNVSLAGRFVVLMPYSDRSGVSRKVDGEERARLKEISHDLRVPEGFGTIVRTVGENERLEDIQSDLDNLIFSWTEIKGAFNEHKGAGSVHSEDGLAVRFVRDYMTSDVSDVLVEDEDSFNEVHDFILRAMPQKARLVRRYTGDLPLFLRYGVERQIEALLSNRVTLPSGGSIVIGQTEALVAIDVNSGKTRNKSGAEEMTFATNLEAATEIGRQVILRDLGGIIVVDFIDMESDAHRKSIEEALKESFSFDKARLSFAKIRDFGLLAFSRQRLRSTVDSGILLPCPVCQGSGRVRSPALVAMSTLRRLRERLATQARKAAVVEVTVPVEVANFLNNRKRQELISLERKFDVLIDVVGNSDSLPDDIRITMLGDVPDTRNSTKQSKNPADTVSAEKETSPNVPSVHLSSEFVRDQSSTQVASPGRERSFFRGLIGRILGLDGLEEIPPEESVGHPAISPARTKTPVQKESAQIKSAEELPAEQIPARSRRSRGRSRQKAPALDEKGDVSQTPSTEDFKARAESKPSEPASKTSESGNGPTGQSRRKRRPRTPSAGAKVPQAEKSNTDGDSDIKVVKTSVELPDVPVSIGDYSNPQGEKKPGASKSRRRRHYSRSTVARSSGEGAVEKTNDPV